MSDSPCSDKCPTYPICINRDSVEKYKVCSHFKDCIIAALKSSQDEIDKEKGKGIMTVVGIRMGGVGQMIGMDGNLISD